MKIWTSFQRRCHKKFWLIRGTKWGEVKVKEAQPPLQLLRRHNLHHFQPKVSPSFTMSWWMEHRFYIVDWYLQWYFTWRSMLLSLPIIMTFIHIFLNPTHHLFWVFTCVFLVFHSYLLPSCVPRSKFTYGMIPQRSSLIASFILWELQFQKSIPISISS